MSRFILHSYKTVLPEGTREAYVVVEDGYIVDVLDKMPESINSPVYDYHEKILMPGIIDPHVHINEPGRTEWEGFETATKAAIYGGVTTLVDMPLNSSPVTTTVQAFEEKLKAAAGKTQAHCGFWGGVVPGNEKEIEPMILRGVLGFKAFLTHSGIDDFPNVTEEDLRKSMPLIAQYGLPLLVHCELKSSRQQPQINRQNENRSYQNYLHSRPKKWEDEAIALMIRLCEEYNCRVHIVHLSSGDSIEQIHKAKQKGLQLTVETAQHYLFFNAEEIADGKTEFKCAPPIREKQNNEQLWQALQEGLIDFVATDHSPSTPDLKELETGNFIKAWGGIASIQFALPALWTAGKKSGCTVADITKWLCTNPARLAGKEKTKGRIEKGFDADLIVWDPDETFTVTAPLIQHRHKITPYLGQELYGSVEAVFLKGEKTFENNNLLLQHRGEIILKNNS